MARRDLLLLHGILPSRRRGCETRDRKPSLFNFFASFFLLFSFEQREIKNIKIWNNISMRKFFDKNVSISLRLIPKSLHRYLQTDQRFRNNRLFPDMAFPLSSLCFFLLLIRLSAEIVAVAQYDRSVARRSYRVFTKYVEDSNDRLYIYDFNNNSTKCRENERAKKLARDRRVSYPSRDTIYLEYFLYCS